MAGDGKGSFVQKAIRLEEKSPNQQCVNLAYLIPFQNFDLMGDLCAANHHKGSHLTRTSNIGARVGEAFQVVAWPRPTVNEKDVRTKLQKRN
jgi:hypothetical protein